MGASNENAAVSEELFSELVQRHWPRLVREAEKYRGRAETAQDIAQAGVINAWGAGVASSATSLFAKLGGRAWVTGGDACQLRCRRDSPFGTFIPRRRKVP